MQRRDFFKLLATATGSVLLSKSGASLAPVDSLADPLPDPHVNRVLVMFKCHFDAGFIDTQTAVVQKYFTLYFPRAIQVASLMRQSGDRRYVWTTGSWLLYEYLEQATPQERKRMEQAIANGDIAWHALPFTWQTELMAPSMISGGIGLSQSLDRRFGRTTTGAKMTDVPGHTRGIVGPLASHGVTFLDIGVNDASTPAQLPPWFVWKAPTGGTLVVMYHHGYGAVRRVPDSELAVAIVVRDDNSGPHTPDEIVATYASLHRQYPNAQVVPTSLTEIANALGPHKSTMPVVTQEIGDTWIHGAPSDPLKLARYREVARLRESWLSQGKFRIGDATDLALLRSLLLEVEHTWGTDTKTWLDFDHYTPAQLAPMLETKNYKVVEFSWAEKRQDLFDGIATLPAPLRQQAQDAVSGLAAKEPQASPASLHPASEMIDTRYFVVGIDPKSGAITRLRNKQSGREWASPLHPLALFSYQTLSQQDYSRFFANYVVSNEDWAKKDFGKPNIERFGAESREWQPTLRELHVEENGGGYRVLASVAIDDADAFTSGRASFPRKLYLELILPNASPLIELNFYWFQKPATRLPESVWLSFNPVVSDPRLWMLDKSGVQVSPLDVVAAGNRHMHALDKGFSYLERNASFAVETLDAPVVALGEKSPLNFSTGQPDLVGGIHCNLFNNAWGTNYIMWFGEDMRFRFVLRG
jgi:Domain of unknown function (DUF5054)